MTENKYNPSIIEEGFGALAIAGCIVTSPLTRSWYSEWGANPEEVEMPLPGDEFVPNPVPESAHAISIEAPADEIWL